MLDTTVPKGTVVFIIYIISNPYYLIEELELCLSLSNLKRNYP